MARIATQLMLGKRLSEVGLVHRRVPHFGVKEAVFPFNMYHDVDPVLGPEMRSTGEAMGIDRDFDRARAKSLLGVGARIPMSGTVFISLRDGDKPMMVGPARRLIEMGFRIIATGGTADYFMAQGLEVSKVNKVLEGRPHIVDALKNGEVHLVFNTTEGAQSIKDSRSIRTTALSQKIPCITTATGARSTVRAIEAMRAGSLDVAPLQAYF
jgi:carbamoyl-phosphate synthase large subunit